MKWLSVVFNMKQFLTLNWNSTSKLLEARGLDLLPKHSGALFYWFFYSSSEER